MKVATYINGDLLSLNKTMCENYSKKMKDMAAKYKKDGETDTATSHNERASQLDNIVELIDKNMPDDPNTKKLIMYDNKDMTELNAKICILFMNRLEEAALKYKTIDIEKYKKSKHNLKRVQQIIKLLGSSIKIKEEMYI